MRRIPIIVVALALSAFGVLVIGMPALFYGHHFGGEISDVSREWADFGEYFGGTAGPLVALAALFALAFTIYLQEVQLTESRAQNRMQSRALRRQRKATNKQMFEATFFQLMRTFSDVARSVRIARHVPEIVGRDAFDYMRAQMKNEYKRFKLYPPADNGVKAAQEIYSVLYRQHEPELGPYFRALYHLFKFIDEHAPATAAEDYASIARSLLSINETVILFYNGTWGEGRDFRRLIEKYGILKHLPPGKLLDRTHRDNRDWYLVGAFQSAYDRRIGSPNPTKTNADDQIEE